MTPEQKFLCWLAGFVELHQEPPNVEQWKLIREQLTQALNAMPISSPPVKIRPFEVPVPFTPIGPVVIPSFTADPLTPYPGAPPVVTCTGD